MAELSKKGVIATAVAGLHFLLVTTPVYAQQPVAGQPPPPEPAAPAPAPAAPGVAGGDVVVLKSGGMLQGTLIDAIPGSHARIQLRTGEIATVRWSEIDHIERSAPSSGQPAAPAAPAPAAPQPQTYAPSGTTAYLHIDAETTVELQYLMQSGAWVTACVSPCDRMVGVDGEYRITGSGVRTTPSFHIAAEQNQKVVLQVTPRNGGAVGLGIAGVVVGGLGVLIGLLVVLVGAAETSFDTTTGTTSHSGGGTEATGWGITIVGGLALTGGIILIAGNSRTKVDQATYPADSQPPAPQARLPVWREIGSSVPAAPAAAPGLPLFSGTF